MRTIAPLALLASFTLFAPGCIIWDAYDQIELANQQLGQINANLEEIDENLGQIDAKLATIDANLDTVDTSLAKIEPMLVQIDEHLASLRKTINNIDSTIPFLKLSGDDEEEQDALNAEDAAPTDADTETNNTPVPEADQ